MSSPDSRSVLDRYTPATLGTVTRIRAATGTGGVTFKAGEVERCFRLPLADLRSLHADLGLFLADYDRRQAEADRGGNGSPISSASSTAASTASESFT